ncbi:protein-methionine-sulfoxide reductase catalytic subunit MsrP [Glaciecola siphonariae]|uniref:Protein-methionine-sulfoxide reductase catalytic subunit MsrP n=1 Tax=Glaciecola siphonariae TaxID=521012 RepID=A0ABV9LSN2_9ALTE
MIIKSPKQNHLTENDVTDEQVYHGRRDLLKKLGFTGAMTLLSQSAMAGPFDWFSKDEKPTFKTSELRFKKAPESVRPLTDESVASSYNNFYEFGTSKSDPKENAQSFVVDPWKLEVSGLVETPITLNYEDLFKRFELQERIYRLRCVEAWSMVIPWIGFTLAELLKAAKPLSSAKYVAFETLYSPEQMPGQRSRFTGGGVDYPYVEGLRLDEAMHDLTLMSVGMYGKTLPPQNGAPIRLVVPWKYGFKSIKSVVKIVLTDKEPPTTWNILAPDEYGFYANVNPKVDHPRWSQGRERRILGSGLNTQRRIDTQMFNGYSEVASLYSNMDLRRFY